MPKIDRNVGFQEECLFFRRKSSKIGENRQKW
jgi:hypothetical protein